MSSEVGEIFVRRGRNSCWERSVSCPRSCNLESHSFSAFIKPHLPLYHWAAPSSEGAGLVHLSRTLIYGNLFYCFRFPSGRYLCWRFHAYRNDVYRPFRKTARKQGSRCAHTDRGRPSGCSAPFPLHGHPDEPSVVIKKPWDQSNSKCQGFLPSPCRPLLLKFSLIGFARSKRGL